MVDDLPQARAFLSRVLEQYGGFRVLTATTVADSLRVLDTTAVDAVVADLWLSGPGAADGGNLLDAVGKWHRGVVRILTTADPLGATIAETGGHLYYDKDDSSFVLISMIRRAVPRA
ncbi:MAG TPA: hypothetical protein VGK73_02645 [Polyangiaceae bacterium]